MITPEEEMPFPVTLLAYSPPGKKQLSMSTHLTEIDLALRSVFQPLWGPVLAVSLVHSVSKVCNVKPRGAF